MALQLMANHMDSGSYLLYSVFTLVLNTTNSKSKWNNDFMILATDLIYQLMFSTKVIRQSPPLWPSPHALMLCSHGTHSLSLRFKVTACVLYRENAGRKRSPNNQCIQSLYTAPLEESFNEAKRLSSSGSLIPGLEAPT